MTVLDVYGSLLYAGARTLQARLPDPAGTQPPMVVLSLPGRTSLGATFFKVVADYADRLRRTRSIEGPVRTFETTPVLGESSHAACTDAEAWLVRSGRTADPTASQTT